MSNPSDAPEFLPDFVSKMQAEGIHPLVIETFSHYYKKIVSGETGLISDSDIDPVALGDLEHADRINDYAGKGTGFLKNAVMIKLNGGLGTSMGLTGAKSLLEVKNRRTFLEVMVMQAEQFGVRLGFMNSFSTQQDTLDALARLKPAAEPLVFLQNKFPKVLQKSLEPATWPENPSLEWNPPGHGDIYAAIYASGTLEQLVDAGIRYAFISNSDNLGATMDAALLGYFAENRFPFMMEVARRTPSDVKGGHLARHKNGRLILREAAQCPEKELDAFRDIERYGFFNTNSIWVNLVSLKNIIEKHGAVTLPMIVNPKTLDPRNPDSPKVFQVETAMGAAISLFEGAAAVQVPVSRFLPVKKCNDLLVIRSDRFLFSDDYRLISNPKTAAAGIEVDLDPEYYGKIDQFDQRFSGGAPSLTGCEALKIRGDVLFEKNVRIKGRVVIENRGKTQAIVREGSVIDKNLVFG